jgi:plastocyanin
VRRAVAILVVLAGWAAVQAPAGTKPTTIAVTAGKPTEFVFKLSKTSFIRPGPVLFKVSNKGEGQHSFKLCSNPKGGTANACVGKATRQIQPGETVSLTVTLKKGAYEYVSGSRAEAGVGMKGQIGVGIKAPSGVTPVTSSAPKTCASPQSTTVNVNEFDFGFTLVPNAVHCGTVTFMQTNTAGTTHNFAINGISGEEIDVGETTTFQTTLLPGKYRYVCQVPDHVGLGMSGTLVVSG